MTGEIKQDLTQMRLEPNVNDDNSVATAQNFA